MNKKSLVIGFVGVLLISVGSVQADFTQIFSEGWSGDTGHNGSNLNNWNHESDYGDGTATDITILSAGAPYGNILSLDPPNRPQPPYGQPSEYSVGIKTKSSYSSAALNDVLSIKSKIQLLDDGGGAGVIAFARSTNPLYGYGLAVSRYINNDAILEIRKFTGTLDSTGFGYHIVSGLSAIDINTYRLQATFNSGSTEFDVYVNGSTTPIAALNYTDDSPVSLDGSVNFVLASNIGQKAYFDDFLAEGDVIPEPATLLLLGLGGMVLRRKNKLV